MTNLLKKINGSPITLVAVAVILINIVLTTSFGIIGQLEVALRGDAPVWQMINIFATPPIKLFFILLLPISACVISVNNVFGKRGVLCFVVIVCIITIASTIIHLKPIMSPLKFD